MQALFFTAPGKLEWREIPSPQIEMPSDAIVEPIAVSMCDLDHNIVNGESPFQGPFVLGHEFVGRVKSRGNTVSTLHVGDVVLASFQPSCGSCNACGRSVSSVCTNVAATSMYGIGSMGGDWGGAMADEIRVPWADYNLRIVPTGLRPETLAPLSDNFADGLRCVETPLLQRPKEEVLIAGQGSISLYALLCAQHLGAEQIHVASKDRDTLEKAEKLGASVMEVSHWPKKLGSFPITVDCTNNRQGLQTVIRSTATFGYCTSASIYFGAETAVPMADMYMKGIQLHTGRVNSASQLDKVIRLVQDGLDPERIEPDYHPKSDAIDVLLASQSKSRKLIFRS